MDKIDSFTNEFEFLAANFPAAIAVDNELYPDVEHAFQAAKTDDPDLKKEIREATSAQEAKAAGRKAVLPSDWDTRKVSVMKDLVRLKFNTHLDLKIKLLETGSRQLSQGNSRKDTFWGVTKDGTGEDHQGKILMEVRDEIRAAEGGAIDVLSLHLEGLGLKELGQDLKYLVDFSKALGDKSQDATDVTNMYDRSEKIAIRLS